MPDKPHTLTKILMKIKSLFSRDNENDKSESHFKCERYNAPRAIGKNKEIIKHTMHQVGCSCVKWTREELTWRIIELELENKYLKKDIEKTEKDVEFTLNVMRSYSYTDVSEFEKIGKILSLCSEYKRAKYESRYAENQD